MDAVKGAASEHKGAISRARACKTVPPAGWLNGRPPAQGLFDPAREHDACGVGFVANMNERASRTTSSRRACKILDNLDHRGAVGADPKAGRRLRHPGADPARLLRGGDARAHRLRAAGAGRLRASACCSCRATPTARASLRGDRRATSSPTKARCSSAGATCRSTTADLGESVKPTEPVHPPGLHRPRHGHRRSTTRSSASSTSCAR